MEQTIERLKDTLIVKDNEIRKVREESRQSDEVSFHLL